MFFRSIFCLYFLQCARPGPSPIAMFWLLFANDDFQFYSLRLGPRRHKSNPLNILTCLKHLANEVQNMPRRRALYGTWLLHPSFGFFHARLAVWAISVHRVHWQHEEIPLGSVGHCSSWAQLQTTPCVSESVKSMPRSGEGAKTRWTPRYNKHLLRSAGCDLGCGSQTKHIQDTVDDSVMFCSFAFFCWHAQGELKCTNPRNDPPNPDV